MIVAACKRRLQLLLITQCTFCCNSFLTPAVVTCWFPLLFNICMPTRTNLYLQNTLVIDSGQEGREVIYSEQCPQWLYTLPERTARGQNCAQLFSILPSSGSLSGSGSGSGVIDCIGDWITGLSTTVCSEGTSGELGGFGDSTGVATSAAQRKLSMQNEREKKEKTTLAHPVVL